MNHKSIDMESLSRNSALKNAAPVVRKGSNSLLGWFAEIWIKRCPTMNEKA